MRNKDGPHGIRCDSCDCFVEPFKYVRLVGLKTIQGKNYPNVS